MAHQFTRGGPDLDSIEAGALAPTDLPRLRYQGVPQAAGGRIAHLGGQGDGHGAMAVGGHGEGEIGQGIGGAAMGQADGVEHVGPHRHAHLAGTGRHRDQFHAQQAGQAILLLQPAADALGLVVGVRVGITHREVANSSV